MVLISKSEFGGDTQCRGLPGQAPFIHSLFTPSATMGLALGQEEESELDSAFKGLSVQREG